MAVGRGARAIARCCGRDNAWNLLPRRIIPAAAGRPGSAFLRAPASGGCSSRRSRSRDPTRRRGPALRLHAALRRHAFPRDASIRLRVLETSGRDVKLPLQRANHAAERLRGAKQQRLVFAGPVASRVCGDRFPRHSNSLLAGRVPLSPRLSKACATLFRCRIAGACHLPETAEGVEEKLAGARTAAAPPERGAAHV